jgi:uncharacterized SAM-binding protein YcdF (DUF218 family)
METTASRRTAAPATEGVKREDSRSKKEDDAALPSPISDLLSSAARQRARRWPRRLAWLLALGAFLFALFRFRAPLLVGLANAWIVDDSLTRADAIVVLGGGIETRPFEAARLYHQSLAPRILILKPSAGPSAALGITPPEVEVNRRILVLQGVPDVDIVSANEDVHNTYEETLAVRRWAETNSVKTLIIATDIFHSRRVRWLFWKQFKSSGVKVLVRAVPVREYKTEDWWRHEQGIVAFQNELLKYVYYRLKH